MITNKAQIDILINRYTNRKKVVDNNASFDRDKQRKALYEQESKLCSDVIRDLGYLQSTIQEVEVCTSES